MADKDPELLPRITMRMLTILALVVCVARPVAAGPFEDALAAYDKGDYRTALRLFRSEADQGYVAAQFNLGRMYAEGQGVPKDDAAAMTWFRKAADGGNADAQYAVAVMYLNGRGAPQDYAQALSWYRKAAAQGYAAAQFKLGDMYFKGQGVVQDYVQAHIWFNLAASRSYQDAANNRDFIAKKMTPAQIAEAQKLAREWKPKPER